MAWLQFIHPWLNKSLYIPNYHVIHLNIFCQRIILCVVSYTRQRETYHGVIYIIFMSFLSTNRNFYGKLRKISVVVGYDARNRDRNIIPLTREG